MPEEVTNDRSELSNRLKPFRISRDGNIAFFGTNNDEANLMYKALLNFLKFKAYFDDEVSTIWRLISSELTLPGCGDANTGCCICHIYKRDSTI